MKLIAKANSNDRPLPPVGMQQAVLYSVIDLGTQETEYMKTIKYQRKINVAWELPHAPKIKYENEQKEEIMRPQCIFKSYTLSLYEKANLAKDLAGWRGQGFTKEEENGFDVFSMLVPGVNALLQIVHYVGNDGSPRARYDSIAKLMPTMTELLPQNPTVQYSTEMHDEFPEGMPDWTIEAIKKSPEFSGVVRAKGAMVDTTKQVLMEDDRDYDEGNPDDTIPF